jgi:hypothetical protein
MVRVELISYTVSYENHEDSFHFQLIVIEILDLPANYMINFT